MKNKCPHCNKIDCIEDVVFNNCEAYSHIGLSGYDLPCRYCCNIIHVTMRKYVGVDSVIKSNKARDKCDW